MESQVAGTVSQCGFHHFVQNRCTQESGVVNTEGFHSMDENR